MPQFMIVFIPYINLLNLSWIIKYLFLRDMEPFNNQISTIFDTIWRNVMTDIAFNQTDIRMNIFLFLQKKK